MPSRDIVVGDVLWIRNEEELPADVIIVGGGIAKTDGGQPECFVQTSSLDGEKTLKKKSVPKGLRINEQYVDGRPTLDAPPTAAAGTRGEARARAAARSTAAASRGRGRTATPSSSRVAAAAAAAASSDRWLGLGLGLG